MTPKKVVETWVERFNNADIDGLVELYADGVINDQIVFSSPIKGKQATRELFELDFSRAKMECIPERLFESGDWAILQWRDPLGMRGCGFFHVQDGKIVHQIGYFDQLTFFKIQGLPVPDDYLNG